MRVRCVAGCALLRVATPCSNAGTVLGHSVCSVGVLDTDILLDSQGRVFAMTDSPASLVILPKFDKTVDLGVVASSMSSKRGRLVLSNATDSLSVAFKARSSPGLTLSRFAPECLYAYLLDRLELFGWKRRPGDEIGGWGQL